MCKSQPFDFTKNVLFVYYNVNITLKDTTDSFITTNPHGNNLYKPKVYPHKN